jgi:hypothetical protein
MMFNKAALLAAAEAEIEARNTAMRAEVDRRNAELADAKRAWMDHYGEAWLTTLTQLRKKLRNGQPIYGADLPSADRYGRVALYGDRPIADRQHKDMLSPDLANLIEVLKTIDDELVSVPTLRTLLTPAALGAALRQLGRSTSKEN